jgi:hypothetical protein
MFLGSEADPRGFHPINFSGVRSKVYHFYWWAPSEEKQALSLERFNAIHGGADASGFFRVFGAAN